MDCGQEVVENNEPRLRYTWDLGDGKNVSPLRDVNHSYEKPGTYTVTAEVTCGECDKVLARETINVIVQIRKFEVVAEAFIPYNFSLPPLGVGLLKGPIVWPGGVPIFPNPDVVFAGDGEGRAFDVKAPRFRIRTTVKLKIDPSTGNLKLIESPKKEVGVSKAHLFVWDPNGYLHLGPIIRQTQGTEFDDVKAGLKVTTTQEGKGIKLEMEAVAGNPIILTNSYFFEIDHCYNVQIILPEEGNPTYVVQGQVDEFPAIALYINGELIHYSLPVENDITSLYSFFSGCNGDIGKVVPVTEGEIKKDADF